MNKNVLISFLSYDQDDFEYKKYDESFMRSFLLPDNALPKDRNAIWRPSVALAQLFGLQRQYKDLLFTDYYILWDGKDNHRALKETIENDILSIPYWRTNHRHLHFEDPGITQPFSTEDVYKALFNYLGQDKFQDKNTTYYVNCANGTTPMRNCLFLFTQTGHINALRIAPNPWENHIQRDKKTDHTKGYMRDGRRTVKGSYEIDYPQKIRNAFISLKRNEAKNTLEILQQGVQTNHTEHLAKIARIIDRIAQIKRPAFRMRQTILITGETGVGKTHLAENIAQALGLVGENGETKFFARNCATMRGADANIQKIELFGSAKKIGETEKTDGVLKLADGGMLFLDEIGELHPEVQAMLLTALDRGEFTPVFGKSTVKSSFQLVCGTNRSLDELVEKGEFRLDLLNRINAWHFQLPPIRDRRDDIEKNVDWLVHEIGKECGYEDLKFDALAKKEFLEFANDPQITWDGNFRELNAMIARMVVLSDQVSITRDIVADEIKTAQDRYLAIRARRSAAAEVQPSPILTGTGPESASTLLRE